MQSNLFGNPQSQSGAPPRPDLKPELDQWFTPMWAAEMLVDRFFSDLGANDSVLEFACGDGAFLSAIPSEVTALGVEIDPDVAQLARENSGRPVLVGDCSTIQLDQTFSALITNPPFQLGLFLSTLDNLEHCIEPGTRLGALTPIYFFQTPEKVLRMSQRWSLRTVNLPRTLFDGLSKPLCFALMERSNDPVLTGFALYAETQHMAGVDREFKALLSRSRSCWAAAVGRCIASLGGRASLPAIYAAMESRRPTANAWWKAKIRQTLSRYFEKVGNEWLLPSNAKMAA